jgi:1-acyl-sn-glycerol-3-phosphate acyltransferase
MDTMGKVKEALKKDNIYVFMMPEGTRSRGKGIGPFKKGAFRLAIETQTPIFPMIASSYYKNLNLNRWKSGLVRLRFLPPISTQGLGLGDLDHLVELARKKVMIGFEELSTAEL